MRRAGYEPDPIQEAYLDSDAREVFLNCSRQWGKSLCSAAKVLYQCITVPWSLCLLIAPALRQSVLAFDKVVELDERLGRPVACRRTSSHQRAWANGSRVVALPGHHGTVRGYSAPAIVVLDEAAWIPDRLYDAISPMLAVGQGQILAPSTPYGRRGWWYDMWLGADVDEQAHDVNSDAWWVWRNLHDDGVLRIKAPAEQCARIPQAWLARERKLKSDWVFSQEYGCQFRDAVDAVFDMDALRRSLSKDIQPLFAMGLTPDPEPRMVSGPSIFDALLQQQRAA